MIALLPWILLACLLWPFAAWVGRDFARAEFDETDGYRPDTEGDNA